MAATRNGTPIRTGRIAIQPARTPIQTPVLGSTTGPTTTVSTDLTQTPIVNVPINPSSVNMLQTSANPTLPVDILTGTTISSSPINLIVPTILNPIVALTGKANPTILSPIVFRSRPSPIKILTEKDMVEETLSLDTHTYVNGQPVLDISNLRGELVAMVDFKPLYSSTNFESFSNFGTYVNDLYQSSVVKDTLRKYVLLNRAVSVPQFNSTLNTISIKLQEDIASSGNTISVLDGLIQKIKEINNVLDLKKNMDSVYVYRPSYLKLRDFVTQRMLFADQSYNMFSDTKILYQLLFDLSGILEKCSFNLLSNFVDADRSAYVNDPVSNRQRSVQDSITLDLTYGDNLKYTSDAIRGKYINDYVTFNGVLNVLPSLSTDRFKFIVNLLSKELRVSKGLGKYDLPEASFFGFRNQGNPFDNVIGGIPADIFIAPLGNNSLSTLFYLKTSTQNAVVLPFESRQVAGDGETVFVPGTNYFSDGILNGDFSSYNNYRETFSNRVAQATNVFNKLLLQQGSFDDTSRTLQSEEMLKSILTYYASSQDLIRATNNDSTNILSFVLFSLGNSDPHIKFEVFKLLLLIALYDTRKLVTVDVTQTDKFRDLLLSELAQQSIQGFSEALTETNIPTLLDNQISIVRKLVLENIAPLPPSEVAADTGLSKGKSIIERQNQRRRQLGLSIPALAPNNRNPENNVALVQVQQFANLIYSLRTTDNLFKNVLDFCKQLFASASSNNQAYHLIDGGSVTRYNALSLSGFILLVFETFSALVDQFATRNVAFNLVSNQETKLAATQYIQVTFVNQAIVNGLTDIRNFLRGSQYNNPIIIDYQNKLGEEDKIIENILWFFELLNNRLTNVGPITSQESQTLSAINTNNPNSLSTTRTAKSILKGIVNKQAVYNPSNNRSLDFYLPAGKAVSERNWVAMRRALYQPEFVSTSKRKLVTVGIPYGFVKAALGARLTKDEVYNGKLEESTSDLINIKLYKLGKNDDGIIYKPQQFKFDLSLFAKGFDAYPTEELNTKSYYNLKDMFQFYDFDEDLPYSEVTAKNLAEFAATDEYYSRTAERRRLCSEVTENLYRSYIFDLYSHMVTGLNTSEETFIAYTEEETRQFVTEMEKIKLGTADLTKVKFMSAEYSELLRAFQSNPDDTKLMLTLCNDIKKTVFRQKVYDRTYNILFETEKFPVDVDAMSQTNEGAALLEKLYRSDMLYAEMGEAYKYADELTFDSYFINVEIIQ